MSDLSDQQLTALTKTIGKACDAIMAAGAESVVVIVTASRPDGMTTHSKNGRGNYYAQRGSVIDWIDATREPGQSSQPPQAPEDGDWWKGS